MAVSRRKVLAVLAFSAWPALPCLAADRAAEGVSCSSAVERLLRAGGCVVLLRHAATDPGVGDPPDFTLGDCRTQRNLSEAGREDACRIGAWFGSRQIMSRAVRSSAWCRCKHTADLAFGKHAVWAALNSTFGDRLNQSNQSNQSNQPDQTALLRQAMARVPARQFEVWVTHQVNISAMAGQGTAMGGALIVDREGRLLARSMFV